MPGKILLLNMFYFTQHSEIVWRRYDIITNVDV